MKGSAIIDGPYRYSLTRGLDDLMEGPGRRRIAWVMLNPSTADADLDDPTIRRVKGFSRAWGFDSLEVVNLFAYRTADTKKLLALWESHAPGHRNEAVAGFHNRAYVELACRRAEMVILAWGSHSIVKKHGIDPGLRGIWPHLTGMCLGTTKDGSPKHPLYLPHNTTRHPWEGYS